MLFNLLVNIQSSDQPGAIKVNVPLVAFTASLAYLAIKVAGSYCSQNWLTSLAWRLLVERISICRLDFNYLEHLGATLLDIDMARKDIPTVALTTGATTHDQEYRQDPQAFMLKCEREYGPVYNVYLMNQLLTIVSGPDLAREFYLNKDLSFADALDKITGMRTYIYSLTKSNQVVDNMVIHWLVRDFVTPKVHLFMPSVVRNMEEQLDSQLEHCDRKLIKEPIRIIEKIVGSAMACVFMGEEIGRQPQVIDTFVRCAPDFATAIGHGTKDFWRLLYLKFKYAYTSPMTKHIKVLVDAATPVILRRRKEEAEQGAAYVRPHDVLQGMLDNFDKYNFVDIEDVCGHLLLLVLASVNTTADFGANMLYYLAQYHEHTGKLREEIQEVLSEEAREIEDLAIKDGNTADAPKIIKPSDALTANALKKMVHLDSFVREALRYRSEMHSFTHLARKDLTLSNGFRIPKGRLVAINLRSTHMEEALQGPDPMEFRPWRFVGKGKSASKVGTDFLQFGMGKRACPGRFIATHDLKALVCLMLSRFSKIEMEDPSKADAALHARQHAPTVTGLLFTSHH